MYHPENTSIFDAHVASLEAEISASSLRIELDRHTLKLDGTSSQISSLKVAIDAMANALPGSDSFVPLSSLAVKPPTNLKTEQSPDVAVPMFTVARQIKKNPLELAAAVALGASSDSFASVESLGPYVNIRVSDRLINTGVRDILRLGTAFGKSNDHEGQVAVVDFSGPNVAKPFGINHLRSTVIGEALSRIFEASGYSVVKDNHLGDWGTQFGNLLAAYDTYGSDKPFDKLSTDDLNALYVRFSSDKKDSPLLVRKGREAFASLNSKDPASVDRWAASLAMSRADFDHVYGRLGITFDTQIGESYFADGAEAYVNMLAQKYPELVVSDPETGAAYIASGEHPVVLRTGDGYCVYAARDLVTIDFRNKTYSPDTIVYVVGEEQASSFRSVFELARQVGLVGETDDGRVQTLEHISFGMLLDEKGKKLSSRGGTSGKLESVIDSVTERAAEEVSRRNPELDHEDLIRVAGKLAIGAIVWNDLKNDRNSSVRFDINQMLELGGGTVVDVLYSYNRSRSALANAGYSDIETNLVDPGKGMPTQEEHELGYSLCEFPDVVRKALIERAPHHIATYLQDLSRLHGSFYEKCRLKGETDMVLLQNRAAIHKAYMTVVSNGLDLLNIAIPEKM